MDVMKGETCLYLWDIHLEEEYTRKGLGMCMKESFHIFLSHVNTSTYAYIFI